VERRFLHKKRGFPFSAPTGLVPVERGFLHQRMLARTDAPHRAAPERRLGHKRCASALLRAGAKTAAPPGQAR